MPVPRSIDHAVLAVPDLDEAANVFETMGFTLTPRAQHPWGTDNRLIQLSDQTFVEVLEVARPELIPEADLSSTPAQFSFGAHTREFLKDGGAGMSMLALKGADAAADAEEFAAHGLGNYAPFPFGRKARQPDGSEKDVAFELAFAHPAALPELVFFTCHNKFPENFWKPDFQRHDNGVSGLAGITVTSSERQVMTDFLDTLTGRGPGTHGGGARWMFGSHWLDLVAPMPGIDFRFSAITLTVENLERCREEITRRMPGLDGGADENSFRICLPGLSNVILAFTEDGAEA